MKKELDEKLCKEFPLLYCGRYADKQTTCMCWGFAIGDGWYDIIYDLSSKLEPLIAEMSEDGRPRASQVKEKFGGLRFYMSSETDEMSKLISEAESASYITCEKCGAPGEQRGGGWVKTLCDECNKK
jgi:hypothetical protein